MPFVTETNLLILLYSSKFHLLNRYRKMLKSVEESIEEPPSLVPKLHSDRRLVPPPSTSPELVMFCRRVYDFRGKRLMDDKKKK